MKKLFLKIRKNKDEQSPSRITSETVAEHRERILAGGRRYKYPIQYARHKLVINTIAISVLALTAILVVGWWQLYKAQNTSEFIYRVTRVIPAPVASVDKHTVLYSDYLMKYISSVHYLKKIEQVSLKTDDGKRQVEYIKEKSLQDAIADSYASKQAKTIGLSVDNKELEQFIKEQRQSSDGELSEKTYYTVIMDYYGWSPSEWRYVMKQKLLRQKVAYEMDKEALKYANEIKKVFDVNPASDLKTLADSYANQSNLEIDFSSSGWVPKDNQDGGLALIASKMGKNQISDVVKSTVGDGYYIIKLKDVNETKVNYDYIKVPLTVFDNALKKIEEAGKIERYISIKKV